MTPLRFKLKPLVSVGLSTLIITGHCSRKYPIVISETPNPGITNVGPLGALLSFQQDWGSSDAVYFHCASQIKQVSSCPQATELGVLCSYFTLLQENWGVPPPVLNDWFLLCFISSNIWSVHLPPPNRFHFLVWEAVGAFISHNDGFPRTCFVS